MYLMRAAFHRFHLLRFHLRHKICEAAQIRHQTLATKCTLREKITVTDIITVPIQAFATVSVDKNIPKESLQLGVSLITGPYVPVHRGFISYSFYEVSLGNEYSKLNDLISTMYLSHYDVISTMSLQYIKNT